MRFFPSLYNIVEETPLLRIDYKAVGVQMAAVALASSPVPAWGMEEVCSRSSLVH